MKRSMFWMLAGVVLGLGAVVAVTLAQPYTVRGSAIEPPQPAPAFTLTGQDGTPQGLGGATGKVQLVFFGYTYCPDVCPSTLGVMQQVLRRLGNDANKVDVIFVTVDPKRDTPEKLAGYLKAFDPRIRGLSGEEATLTPVWQAYGVYRAERAVDGDVNGYLVDHSARVYAIDAQGKLRATYPFGFSVDDLLSDVRFFLRG